LYALRDAASTASSMAEMITVGSMPFSLAMESISCCSGLVIAVVTRTC
jgi:hypothetical protein